MDNLKRALKEATRDEKIAIIAHIIDEDPDILENIEVEGYFKDKLRQAGDGIKKYGPGIAKTVGKTIAKAGLDALEKTGEVATGAVIGAAKGAYGAARDKPPTK